MARTTEFSWPKYTLYNDEECDQLKSGINTMTFLWSQSLVTQPFQLVTFSIPPKNSLQEGCLGNCCRTKPIETTHATEHVACKLAPKPWTQWCKINGWKRLKHITIYIIWVWQTCMYNIQSVLKALNRVWLYTGIPDISIYFETAWNRWCVSQTRHSKDHWLQVK